ncbi:MAG TPA: diacylglycerol kinase family protein [Candidatus Acidoferrum sp.]|nr:diacylglycerol kinase family protein [Candidatus Acidoferrum sp.]
MPKRVLLAVNDRARRGREMRERSVLALRALGHVVTEVSTGRPGDLSQAIIAHRNDVDVVVVGGGDGTLLWSIEALIETKLPLAILPLGTYNELARTLGVPSTPEDVASLIDEGLPLPIDVGRVNGVPYFNEASIGLSTRIARYQTSEIKKKLGLLVVPVTALRALQWMRPLHLEVEADDGSRRILRAVQVTVANNYRFGGFVENPEGSLEDGHLWLYSIDVRGWLHTLGILIAVALRRFPHAPDVVAVRGKRFVIRSLHGHAHRILADSEEVAHLPAEFTVVPAAVTVLVPERSVTKIR